MMHSIILLLILVMPLEILSHKVLVVPFATGFNSRLLNMQKLADILAQDGHEVTVLMNTKVSEHRITKYANVIEFTVPETQIDVTNLEMKPTNTWSFFGLMDDFIEIEASFFHALTMDKMTLESIHNAKFDLIFSDHSSMIATLVVSHLNITTIWYQNFLMPLEAKLFYPVMPSFVCTMPSVACHTYEMSFTERLANFFLYTLFNHYMTNKLYEPLVETAVQNNFTLTEPIMTEAQKNKLVVINANYVLDTPMPTMPHIFPISGLFHKKPSPLNDQFANIIESSKPHGVILLSFGTLMPEFDAAKADMFAGVLGRLPHSVIWRFTGHPPKSLKANTHLVKWFPQNDLLANPAVKLFITHCGISSTFESAFHGVPILAMPLFAEQDDNADKLTKRIKTGKKLDFYTLTEAELEESLEEVLTNAMFKENARKASIILNDHLVSPQYQLRHLVNFTIETGGAPHLFHPYAVDMSWFHFYAIDVILFLVTCISLFGLAFILAVRLIIILLFKEICRPKKDKTA